MPPSAPAESAAPAAPPPPAAEEITAPGGVPAPVEMPAASPAAQQPDHPASNGFNFMDEQEVGGQSKMKKPELEFLNNLWGLGTE
jgi:hypothetical protein